MEIKSFNPAVLLEWLPDGHLEGNEFVALNPNREDRTKGSFKINVWNTFWADHAIENAAGRGASSLIAYLFPIVTKWSMATGRLKPWQPPRDDPANAGVKWLEGDYAPPMADIFRVAEEALLSPPPEGWLPPQGSSSRSRSRDRSKLVTPVPFLADLNAYLYRDWRLGKPSKFWPYHNEAGELLGFQMRFDLSDGDKEFRPLTYWGRTVGLVPDFRCPVLSIGCMKLPAVERRSSSSPRARRQRTRRSGSSPMPLRQPLRMERRRRKRRTGR